jgi:GTP-binding protein
MNIVSAKYLVSSPRLELCPAGDRPEYAFIGRSNVGKSSLINMLCNQRQLAKTSGTPGKTQMINHFEIESQDKEGGPRTKWYVVDLPGYGFAKVSQKQRGEWEKMIKEYIQKRENLVTLFALVDARHEPQKADLEFINKLGEWQVPFCIVFTKADKETQKVVAQHVREFMVELKKTWSELPGYFVTSAEKRLGRDQVLEAISHLNAEYGRK